MKQGGGIYLDFAAATPVDETVLQSMQPFLTQQFYNPSADYQAARNIKRTLNEARASVASYLGAKPGELFFCAGGTEANNLAIKGVMDLYPEAKVLTSSIEHESVLAPAKRYRRTLINVDPKGRIDLEHLTASIDDSVALVSVMYANNEVGTIQPLKQIGAIIAKVRAERKEAKNKLPLLFHTDACQAANYLDLHVSRLGVDLMTLNGGKIYGPKQSAVLFVKRGTFLQPLIDGGGQELGIRSGTENVAADIGFAHALKLAQSQRDEQNAETAKLRDYFIEQLQKEIKTAVINGSLNQRLANNIHVSFTGADNEVLLMALDQAGIMAAAGSACSAAHAESSHVLLAMGLSDTQARSSLRFSLGRTSQKADIERTISVLKTLVK